MHWNTHILSGQSHIGRGNGFWRYDFIWFLPRIYVLAFFFVKGRTYFLWVKWVKTIFGSVKKFKLKIFGTFFFILRVSFSFCFHSFTQLLSPTKWLLEDSLAGCRIKAWWGLDRLIRCASISWSDTVSLCNLVPYCSSTLVS